MEIYPIEEYFADYSEHHHNPRNVRLHFIGIPLIVIAVLGMLVRVRITPVIPVLGGPLTAGLLLLASANFFYLLLHFRLGLTMIGSTALCYLIGMKLPLAANVALFVAGWIIQLYGHKIEGKKPAFTENLVHLFIGPIFVQNKVLKIIK